MKELCVCVCVCMCVCVFNEYTEFTDCQTLVMGGNTRGETRSSPRETRGAGAGWVAAAAVCRHPRRSPPSPVLNAVMRTGGWGGKGLRRC